MRPIATSPSPDVENVARIAVRIGLGRQPHPVVVVVCVLEAHEGASGELVAAACASGLGKKRLRRRDLEMQMFALVLPA
jgi:hypothetical protein